MLKFLIYFAALFIPNSSLRKQFRARMLVAPARRKIKRNANHEIALVYQTNNRSELSALCQKHGTDKGYVDGTHPMNRVHNYADYYEIIFGGIRMQVNNVLECGILRGESLRLWKEYFPTATITGIDIDETRLFTEPRIETYQADQTDPESIRAFVQKIPDRKFNIIIDDGLHTAKAAIAFFNGIKDRLTDDGIYVIEDVTPADAASITEYFNREVDDWHLNCVFLHRHHEILSDNTLITVTRR